MLPSCRISGADVVSGKRERYLDRSAHNDVWNDLLSSIKCIRPPPLHKFGLNCADGVEGRNAGAELRGQMQEQDRERCWRRELSV